MDDLLFTFIFQAEVANINGKIWFWTEIWTDCFSDFCCEIQFIFLFIFMPSFSLGIVAGAATL